MNSASKLTGKSFWRNLVVLLVYLFEESQIDLGSVVIRDTEVVFDRFVTFFVSLNKHERQYLVE